MTQILQLPTFSDARGDLTVIEKILPFEVRRVYYMYNVRGNRGGHRHKKTIQALICLNGSCSIVITKGDLQTVVVLSQPNQLLLLYPDDYHTMENFSDSAILMVLSSELFDPDDYIDTPL